MSSAISVLPVVYNESSEPHAEVSPSRFVYRIFMNRTPGSGYHDVMIVIADNGDFSVTMYDIGSATDHPSGKGNECWAMVRAGNVERLSYALASAAGGPGKEAFSGFVRRPNVTVLECECVERVIRISAQADGLNEFTRLLVHHGVPFESWRC